MIGDHRNAQFQDQVQQKPLTTFWGADLTYPVQDMDWLYVNNTLMCSIHPFPRLEKMLWALIQFHYSRRVFILGFQIQCAGIKSISILIISFWASAKLWVEGYLAKPENWDSDPGSSCLWLFQLQQDVRQTCSEEECSNMYMHIYMHSLS